RLDWLITFLLVTSHIKSNDLTVFRLLGYTEKAGDWKVIEQPISAGSGCSVSDICIETFQELKLRKKYKGIIFRIENEKEIVVESTSDEPDFDAFASYISSNYEDKPRYVVYDLEYELPGGEGKRSKIIFFLWNAPGSRIRERTLYTSSKAYLRLKLTGVSSDVQINDFDDFATVKENIINSK
ncbi:9547_t:CDS:2, partial [Ambispora leptoticha]